MKRLKSISLKLFCSLLATTMIISGSFLMNKNVYADTITVDGTNLIVDSYVRGSDGLIKSFVKDGINYIGDGWAMYDDQANKLWVKTAVTGVLTAQAVSDIIGLNKAGQVVDGWVLDGVEYGKQWLADGWNSIQNQLQNGTLDTHGSWLAKKLLGAVGSLDNVYTNVRDAVNNLPLDVVETSNRNYYTSALANNVYNTGATKYYPVANTQTQTFYNTYDNTYETINNYDYDIYNNYYNYYTTENHYHVSNVYNNTYVFNVGGNYDYELYYKLPDGSNSFNLTPENIHGIKLDLNVDNYEMQNSNSDVLGLYHLNGNNINVYNNDNLFVNNSNYFPYNSNNYVDSLLGFDTAYMSTSQRLFKLNNNDIKNVRFYLYYSATDNYRLLSASADLTNYDYRSDWMRTLSKNNLSNGKIFIDTSNTAYSNFYLASGINFSDMNRDSFNLIEFNKNDNNEYELYINGVEYNNFYYVGDGLTKNDISINWTYYQLVEYDNYYHLLLYPNSSMTGAHKNAYIYKFNFNNLLQFVHGYQFNYYIIDELRISNKSNINHGVNYLPFNDGIYYTLPLKADNNNLLIKSKTPVNNYQFGGIRKGYSDSVIGDVFVNIVNNTIDKIEQYDGHDWIAVDGAIYSDKLGMWVNAIGYSIALGDWSYSDVNVNDVQDIPTLGKWLSGALNNLADNINKSFEKAINNLKDLIGINKSNSIILDNNYDIDVDNDVSGYLNDINDIEQTIDFDLENEIGNDFDNVALLASTTKEIFTPIHENGMDIIWLAPLVVLIVRLVI